MSTSVDTVRCSLAPGMLAPIMMWRGRVTEVLCQWMDFHGRCCNQHTDQPCPDGSNYPRCWLNEQHRLNPRTIEVV